MYSQSNISVMTERKEDELLVEQSIRNNEVSFESLVEQYSEDVALLANRLLGWPGEVEDITQEVFLASFLGLKKFRHDCSIKTWLFTITINKCRSFRYKQLFRRQKILDRPRSKSSVAADRKMQAIETSEKVRNAVQALPAKYREAVVLRYLEELPTEEIGRILSISVNTLHVRLSRARERLKQDLVDIMEF
jgi:RNA polymerase sigma-70 factor (ECF subfamily)